MRQHVGETSPFDSIGPVMPTDPKLVRAAGVTTCNWALHNGLIRDEIRDLLQELGVAHYEPHPPRSRWSRTE